MACLEYSNNFRISIIYHDLIYAIQFVIVKNIDMLIQNGKMTTIYVTSHKFFKDGKTSFCFKRTSSIQLFLLREVQYFEFLS